MSLLNFKICRQKSKVVSNILKTNILTYCLKCKRNTEKKDKTKNGRVIISSKCPICGSKKSIFMKEQEAKGLLSNLGIKTSLSEIPLLGDLSF